MNRLLTTALAYAARRWLILPLHTPDAEGCSCGQDCGGSRGKHPRTPHGLYDASRQPDQLWRWWQRWPDANIGIRTGQGSSLVVLDVDVRHGGDGSLCALEALYERLPPTLTAHSGGGGQHRYFRHPGGPLLPNRIEVGGYAGLDVRADGGYIVAPPSRHQSGQLYRWQEPIQPLVALPDWLCVLFAQRTPPASPLPPHLRGRATPDRHQFWLRLALERARPGRRNETGYWLACRLREAGVSFAEAEAVLRDYAAQVAAGEHPYLEREALASLHSAYHHPALASSPATCL